MLMPMLCPTAKTPWSIATAIRLGPPWSPYLVVVVLPVHASTTSGLGLKMMWMMWFPLQSIADPEETDWEDILSSEFPITEEATTWLPQYSPVQLWNFQMDDPDVAPLIEWLESGEPPSIEKLYLSSPAIKHWWLSQSQLELHHGVLYY